MEDGELCVCFSIFISALMIRRDMYWLGDVLVNDREC